jgi:hypothetical protein
MPNTTQTTISAKTISALRNEAGRSRIIDAAVAHLQNDRGISLANADKALSWGLDFTLHISADQAGRPGE